MRNKNIQLWAHETLLNLPPLTYTYCLYEARALVLPKYKIFHECLHICSKYVRTHQGPGKNLLEPDNTEVML